MATESTKPLSSPKLTGCISRPHRALNVQLPCKYGERCTFSKTPEHCRIKGVAESRAKLKHFHGLSTRKMGSVDIARQHGSKRAPRHKKNQHKPFHAYKHKSKQNGSKLVCASKPGQLERFYVNKPRPRVCRPTACTARTRCNLPTLFSAKTGPYTDASYVHKETM